MTNEIITLDQAINSLRGRPGLVFGPLATSTEDSFSLVIKAAIEELDGLDYICTENISTELDALYVSDPQKAKNLENKIKDQLIKLKDVNNVSYLVNAGWSMCISLTRDILLESALKNHQDSKPTSKTVTIIDHVTVRPDSRTIPIYKLLGNIQNQDTSHSLVLKKSELLLKKRSWHLMLGTCTDFLRGNPLLFFGTSNIASLVQELLSNLSMISPPTPNSLIFLKGDPLLENPTVVSLCNSFSNVKVVDATIREFSKAINEMKPKQARLNLVLPDAQSTENFSSFESIVSIVPSKDIDNDTFLHHRQALVDSLFRPTTIDWDPYLCNIDIKRDITEEILNRINETLDTNTKNTVSSLIIRGNAAIGKTTILKRAAVEISKQGYVSLWCRRAPIENWIRTYKSLCEEMNIKGRATKDNPQKYVIFVDDPYSLKLDPQDLVACFDKSEVPIIFIFSLRNTDYFNQNGISNSLPYTREEEIEIPTQLTQTEFDHLSKMLVRISAVTNEDEANKLITNVQTKNTDDVLCSLWYLVPETRSNLSESLKDEYLRLGAASSSITDFAHNAQALGRSVQHAYEYVCVASNLQIPLPMEVLVRSLKINYEEFIEMSAGGKPLWGLIYGEDDEENHTVLYRTRNEIVTDVLLDLVNGGVGYTGEFRVLKTLLSSCDGGSQVYRDFAKEVLVKKRKNLENKFSYDKGLELYNVAENALLCEDKLLAHHKGIWMHRIGKDFKNAYKQFEKALELQEYPGDRKVYSEHIQTSMAASVVGLVKEGAQSASSGFDLVQEHLQQAANPKIFSAHTGHISANLLFELAQQQDTNISNQSYSSALQVIEKTLQAIGPYKQRNTRSDESIEMLKSLQGNIVSSVSDDDELEDYAYSNFEESHNQLGFELLLRKQFAVAQISDKGSAYNKLKDKILEIIAFIENKSEIPNVEIYAIKTDLLIRWRLQKPTGSIGWEEFKNDLTIVLDDSNYRDDPIKNYYLAIALFHLNDIEGSNAIFSNIRRMRAYGLSPQKFRNYYVGPEGHPKRFQCSIDRKNGRNYADIPEIATEIQVAGSNREIVTHTYIGFSLNGPSAVYDTPDSDQMLLS